MKKLIAKRPVLYQGRMYQPGDALPAADLLMESAWLRSGSAVSTETGPAAGVPLQTHGANEKAIAQVLECLAGLGLKCVDDSGDFVGNENFTDQIRVLGRDLMQDYGELLPPVSGMPADGGLPEETEALDIDPDGHFTRESLSRLTKAQLMDLADDLGVDLSGCRNNAERVEALAAVDGEGLLSEEAPEDVR